MRLFLGDCREFLGGLEDECVDLAVIDPPYGIGYKSAWKIAWNGLARKNRADFGRDVLELDWIAELYRVMKANTLVYCFTRWDVLHVWKKAFEAAGFRTRGRLAWDKRHWTMGDLSVYGSQVEDVLLLGKGKRAIFPGGKGRRGNLFAVAKVICCPEGSFDHPTQKPEALLERFILDGSREGEVVLDCFMGVGSTGAAAKRAGREFWGCEIDGGFFETARKRLN